MRSAIQTQSIVHNARSQRWEFADSANVFEQNLKRNVALVVEGMVAHLDREYRKAAEGLATLGEVFARETALELDSHMEDTLIALMSEGIIVETIHPVSPLCSIPLSQPGKGWQVEYPHSGYPLLVFTHSLLHDYLANRARPDIPALLQLINEDAPLYSLLPIRLLEKARISNDTSAGASYEGPVGGYLQLLRCWTEQANWRDGAKIAECV